MTDRVLKLLTPDAPDTAIWMRLDTWFRSLIPPDAVWSPGKIGLPPDHPEQTVNVRWVTGRRGWHVQQVAHWYEVRSGLLQWNIQWELDQCRRLVAFLRVVGALPMPTLGRTR
jgi:hypothetical protein